MDAWRASTRSMGIEPRELAPPRSWALIAATRERGYRL
jgi:hypothetical protein